MLSYIGKESHVGPAIKDILQQRQTDPFKDPVSFLLWFEHSTKDNFVSSSAKKGRSNVDKYSMWISREDRRLTLTFRLNQVEKKNNKFFFLKNPALQYKYILFASAGQSSFYVLIIKYNSFLSKTEMRYDVFIIIVCFPKNINQCLWKNRQNLFLQFKLFLMTI